MVVVEYQGRLGNNLFQYALGRIIAERLGLRLVAAPLPGFPATATPVEGESVDRDELVLAGHQIPLPDILGTGGRRRIVLRGYFQDYRYYRPWKREIRRWLAFTPPGAGDGGHDLERPDAADLVASVRAGTDQGVANFMRAVPFGFYAHILRRSSWARLHVVTDAPDHPLPRALARRFGGQIRSRGPYADFHFLLHATRLIMSPSTFTWWAAWLSRAETIYYPSRGIWNRWLRPDINLVVDDEAAYVYPDRWRCPLEWARHLPWILRNRRLMREHFAHIAAPPAPRPPTDPD